MNILSESPPLSNCPAIISPQQIELRGVFNDSFGLHAVFTAGPSQRIVPVERRHLSTFVDFRERVAEFLQIRIAFAGDWSDAVAAAFSEGAAI
ncbi:hypothetical protein [Lacipirellula parvula]|uniref:Uncharacterized protein n=1 Tax=Lacipirellula parvula TaxID=2650471 RepID=A0A5K7X623_9BACT|nr:hypothetical protein [Lacipirellula parvula]BBO31948.1 hypothetical protein PLANPX_1560 [Lacipirellula parvula]